MSQVGAMNSTDLKKIGKGLIIAVVGAVLTYGTETIPGVNLGSLTPIVVAGWSIVANFVRKWLSNSGK